MSETIDAVIDKDGIVRLLKPVHLSEFTGHWLQYWTMSRRGKATSMRAIARWLKTKRERVKLSSSER